MTHNEMLKRRTALSTAIAAAVNATDQDHRVILEALFLCLSTAARQSPCCADRVASGAFGLAMEMAALARDPVSVH